MTTNRFRPQYRSLATDETARIEAVKDRAEELAQMMEEINPSRERALAITKIEEAVMWWTKAATSA